MAGNAVIGALRVVLGMDAGEFVKGSKQAEKAAADFSSRLTAATRTGVLQAEVIMRAFDRAFDAVVRSITRSLDEMDKIGKVAQQIGVPVEQLSALKLAANLADVSLEELSADMGKFARNVAQASENAGGDFSRTMRGLGIALKNSNGEARSQIDLLKDLADRFQRMPEGVEKTDIAMTAFGRTGKNLIPFLNGGRQGIDASMEAAKRLAVTFSTETAKAAEEFNDTIKRLKTATDGLAMSMTQDMLPALQMVASGMESMIGSTDSLQKRTMLLLGSIGDTISGWLGYGETGEIARRKMMDLVEAGRILGTTQVVVTDATKAAAAAAANWNTTFHPNIETAAQYAQRVAVLNKVVDEAKNIMLNSIAPAEAVRQQQAAMQELLTQNGISQDVFNKALIAATAAYQQNTISAAENAGVIFTWREKLEQQLMRINALEAQGALNADMAARARAGAAQMAAQNAEAAAASVGLQNSVYEQYGKTIQRISELEDAGALTAEQSGRAREIAALNVVDAHASAASAIGNSLTQLFDQNKGVAIASALINTFQAASAALKNPPGPPFSYAYVAAAIASGMAQVANIRKTSKTSTGGGSTGGGASGAGAATAAAASAAAAAPVSAAPAEQQRSGTAISLTLKGHSFGRDQMREFVENLNEYIKDGGRIHLVA